MLGAFTEKCYADKPEADIRDAIDEIRLEKVHQYLSKWNNIPSLAGSIVIYNNYKNLVKFQSIFVVLLQF